MAVISCSPIWEERTGSRGKDGALEFVRSFRVQTDSPLTEQVEILTTAGIPAYGSMYVVNGFTWAAAFLNDIKVAPDQDDPLLWRVTCRYSTKDVDKTVPPVERPTKYDYKTEWVEVATAVDLDGKNLVNSAYEPLDTISKRVPCLVITAKKNFETFDAAVDYYPWVDTFNGEEFLGYGVGEVLLDDISISQQEEDGVTFNERTYTFKVRTDRDDPWLLHVLDQGFSNWDPVAERQYTAYTMDGQPPQKPILLDGTGQSLAIWDTGVEPVYLTFRMRNSASFGDIGL